MGLGLSWAIAQPAPGPPADPRDQQLELNLDPQRVVGPDACSKCHAAEVQVWKNTPHFHTFATLHRRPEARQIADRMGISEFRRDSACTQCHYTMQTQPDGRLQAIAGVSCESCHGAARDWLEIHNDYGGPGVTREQESAQHRLQRLQRSIAAGMRNPVNVYLVARSCYRCHTVPDERLVNVGGHRPGSLDFELVSWSQGTLRHNFLRGDGHTNAPSAPDRLRTMFVAGIIADLEFSLRAAAKATAEDKFAIVSAQRADRASRRLQAIEAKTHVPLLRDILHIYQQVDMSLGNQAAMAAAADEIAALGIRFAAQTDPQALEPIEAYIPQPSVWK
ncbi:MAG: cytochrome C554 [Planctomycetota bacterium]|nr:MAG: cytochrome C554 [Planctomycetota bacterium]